MNLITKSDQRPIGLVVADGPNNLPIAFYLFFGGVRGVCIDKHEHTSHPKKSVNNEATLFLMMVLGELSVLIKCTYTYIVNAAIHMKSPRHAIIVPFVQTHKAAIKSMTWPMKICFSNEQSPCVMANLWRRPT